jgi:hypothetical protein
MATVTERKAAAETKLLDRLARKGAHTKWQAFHFFRINLNQDEFSELVAELAAAGKIVVVDGRHVDSVVLKIKA